MVGLGGDDLAYVHGTGEDNHRQDGQSHGKLVADHLGAGTESADKGELIVGRPTGQQNSQHADRRTGKQEEDADIEVDNLQTVAPGQHGEPSRR